jgi:hypothetical protein
MLVLPKRLIRHIYSVQQFVGFMILEFRRETQLQRGVHWLLAQCKLLLVCDQDLFI